MSGMYRIRKYIAIIILSLFLVSNCFMLSSCSCDSVTEWVLSELLEGWNPTGDWRCYLINDYYIIRSDATRIILYNDDPNRYVNLPMVDKYITCFAYNDRFVAVRKLDVPEGYGPDDIFEMNFDEAKYFIVDTETDEVYGPYESAEDFESGCKEIQTGDLGEWIDTYPPPKGSDY